jgi:hypothetical protein
MNHLKAILIICVLVIGAADIIIYNYDVDLFSLLNVGDVLDNSNDSEKFTSNLQNASKFEGIWDETMNVGVISKINRYVKSPNNLKKNLPEIKSSLSKARDANENTLKHLNDCKKYASSDVEKQYIDLLLQKANINKKILDSYTKMMPEYEKFANKNLSPEALSAKMAYAKQDLIDNNAIDTDIRAIDTKILDLFKIHPDFKEKLGNMNLNPSFMGQTY